MQMRYFGYKRTSWLCSGPLRLFQEAGARQRYTSRAPLALRVTAWWMIAERELRKCSQGRSDMRESWDIHALALFRGLLPHSFFFFFCPTILAAESSNMRSFESSSGRSEGLPLEQRLTGGGSRCIVFQRQKIWRFKSCLNRSYTRGFF